MAVVFRKLWRDRHRRARESSARFFAARVRRAKLTLFPAVGFRTDGVAVDSGSVAVSGGLTFQSKSTQGGKRTDVGMA
jgi:hypothetical protein